MELLRFATAGSVDDGKSTLIGRLLHDTKSLLEDTIEAVEISTARRGGTGLDLALITDGLRAEREQGITIDVAYRYFATSKRSFVIADTPGHVQYTRNMVTGASNSELAIILVDARHGLKEQSFRHASIASMLGIGQLVFAVNKMDLVDWSSNRFHEIEIDIKNLAARLGLAEWLTIPLSALSGDNVVERSESSPWYAGPTLLEHLEAVRTTPVNVNLGGRLNVQWIVRPSSNGDTVTGDADADAHARRWYCGPQSGTAFRVGDKVVVLPGGTISTITAVVGNGAATRIQLADERDVSRGDIIAHLEHQPTTTNEFSAMVCAMGEEPLAAGSRLLVKNGTRTTQARILSVQSRVDIVTGIEETGVESLGLNDIGRVRFSTAQSLTVDDYRTNRLTGSLIAMHPLTNNTVLAGMISLPDLFPD